MLPCSMRVAGVMLGNEAVLSPRKQAFAAERLSVTMRRFFNAFQAGCVWLLPQN